MKKSAWRLALSAALFTAWIGYLAYLAATTTQPIVLSRPQFLAAELYAVAHVPADPADADQPTKTVTVKQVFWAANTADKDKKSLQITELPSLKVGADQKANKAIKETDRHFVWDGAGDYILALSRSKIDPESYVLTPLPRTPGFQGAPGRIYPATPTTLRQLELLVKEYHP